VEPSACLSLTKGKYCYDYGDKAGKLSATGVSLKTFFVLSYGDVLLCYWLNAAPIW
jgi:hypothetical protein